MATKNVMAQYIMRAAQQRGIDPNIALKVAKSEGLNVGPAGQSNYRKNGVREPSYGPFQLLVGGPGTGFPAGLGNSFMERTGLDPRNPANWQAGVDFALDTAKNDGWRQWYGAANTGIGRWQGIKNNSPYAVDVHDTQHEVKAPAQSLPPQAMAAIPPEVAEYAMSDENQPNMMQRLGAAISAMEGPTPRHGPGFSGGSGPGNQLLKYLNAPTMADNLLSKRLA